MQLFYDASYQRWKQVYVNAAATETTYYIGGLLEKVIDANGTDWRHYIYPGNGGAAVAIMSRKSIGTNATRYILDDHQWSVAGIRDSSGNLVVNESFTAYGARRNSATWSGPPTSGDLTAINSVTRQGYTSKTALGNMGLNHMNGRVQDAVVGVFISADPQMVDSGNTQGFNRYGYVYNNPLSHIDPSGFSATAPDGTPVVEGCQWGQMGIHGKDDELVCIPGLDPEHYFDQESDLERMLRWINGTLDRLMSQIQFMDRGDDITNRLDQSPQCTWKETDGNWTVTFGGYSGPGFEMTFGSDHGNGFSTFRFGFGAGGGFSYDPNPSIPGPEPSDRSQSGWVLSASGQLNFNAGPLGANVEAGVARNYNNSESAFYGGPSISAVSERWGLNASASAAGQVTYYTGRTKYLPIQQTCHL